MVEKSHPQHILVACAENPASLFAALPAFQSLKTAFPQARITAYIDASGQAILQGYPAVDGILTAAKKEGVFRLAGRFRGLGADSFISLYPRPKPVLAAWLAKIPARIGMLYKWQGFFLTDVVRMRRAVSDRNEVEYNFELLKPLGVSQFAEKIEFPITEAQKAWVREFLGKKGMATGTPYVIVHPGSRGRALHWKMEKYGQLLGYLCQVKGFRVVVTSVPGEEPLMTEVMAPLFSVPPEQKPLVVSTGELDLKQLAALCQGALCLFSGPLGPMQLAAAVGTPTVTVFSPAPDATPERWGPWGNDHTILIPQNKSCSGCMVGYCKKHDPMDALTAPEALEAVLRYVRRAVPA
jgi:ADP-heptose:LPS heptosyltransferase